MPGPQKYRRCLVLAGGGFRFGIYLGMFAAVRDAGRSPDLLLASCGGAIAAALIQSLPDDAQRKAWLCSPDMYRYWCDIQPSARAGVFRALAQAVKRKLSSARAPLMPDLFDDYLFDLPPHLPLPSGQAESAPIAVAIVGAKLLFDRAEVGQPRGNRKLFAETVFCEPRAAALLHNMASPLRQTCWGPHAISEVVQTDPEMTLSDAVRISVSDCFYVAAPRVGASYYSGGMVDLFPIEVARQLAQETMMEFKQGFDQHLAIPAWRNVLGLDGNQRLRHVHSQDADLWIDTSDVSQALAKAQIQKRLDWHHRRIILVAPPDHATYVRAMEAQWHYGYQRGQEACARTTPHPALSMRQVTRYNRPQACVF